MKKTASKSKEIIVTMSKAEFDKLSSAKKRMAIAQDVIDRIKFGQFIARNGTFCKLSENWDRLEKDVKIEEALKNPKKVCEVCAKGGLFMAYIGIKNNFDADDLSSYGLSAYVGQELNAPEMIMLSKIFSKNQLSLIESCFENIEYSWNETLSERQKLRLNYFVVTHRRLSDNSKLTAICKNIIKNNGTFKP